MLHARTHPQCSRSRAGSRVQLVSVVIGLTILPTTDAKCTRASERGKEGRERVSVWTGVAEQTSIAIWQADEADLLVEGCVILPQAAQPLPTISQPQVTLLLFR